MRLFGTQRILINGELSVGGIGVKELAQTYKTPLYIMDEAHIRHMIYRFKQAFKHPELDTEVCYASKAFMNTAMAQLIHQEGLSLDVVSGGELYTAIKAGFPSEKIYFHGNNKSYRELLEAVEAGVGTIVIDHSEEFDRLCTLLKDCDTPVKVMLRVNPGIEAHTHNFIQTTKNDSKFGMSLFESETQNLLVKMAEHPQIKLLGIHCHIGSQIFDVNPFLGAIESLLQYIAEIKKEGVNIQSVSLGGGFGVYYTAEDMPLEPETALPHMLNHFYTQAKHLGLGKMKVIIEPGRALVANAGITLYTSSGEKLTHAGKRYVFVDGSMNDHLRTALYGAKYEAGIVNRCLEKETKCYTIAGKACESGDILIRDIPLPTPKTGDLLAVMSTGAYHYSMASNYNRLSKPAVVFVKEGIAKCVVKRESYDDLIRNDQSLFEEVFHDIRT